MSFRVCGQHGPMIIKNPTVLWQRFTLKGSGSGLGCLACTEKCQVLLLALTGL